MQNINIKQGQNPILTSNSAPKCAKVIDYIDNLTAFGIFTPEQGQILKQKMTLNNTTQQAKSPELSVFDEFLKEEPTFFNEKDFLLDYLKNSTYQFDKNELKKVVEIARRLENEAILRVVKNFENLKNFDPSNGLKSALDVAYDHKNMEKSLEQGENAPDINAQSQAISEEIQKDKMAQEAENALLKLNSVAFEGGFGTKIQPQKTYTRAEIASMSDDEFIEHEKEIMEQFTKGLIK